MLLKQMAPAKDDGRNLEARIFMKFYMVVNYYLVNLSFKFHDDLRINASARVVNARVHVLLQVCAFMTRARAFVHGSL